MSRPVLCGICGATHTSRVVNVCNPSQPNAGQIADLCETCHSGKNHLRILQEKIYPTLEQSDAVVKSGKDQRSFEISKQEWLSSHPGEQHPWDTR